LEGVSVAYDGIPALEDVSFTVRQGDQAAVVGPNGAGKSTLFNVIAGIVRPQRGSVRVYGSGPRGHICVGYVPQRNRIDLRFPVSVHDVAMMGRIGKIGLSRWPGRRDKQIVGEALEQVEMQSFVRRQIGELSGGQKKRVFLARALAQEGQVILLDEPFTGVDVKTEDAIIALLRSLREEGKVMLVSTHNLGSVPEFCDRTVLVKGTVLASGPTEEIFTRELLEKTFGGALRHFALAGAGLHDDDDPRHLSVLTDDERPLVMYGEKGRMTHKQSDPVKDQ